MDIRKLEGFRPRLDLLLPPKAWVHDPERRREADVTGVPRCAGLTLNAHALTQRVVCCLGKPLTPRALTGIRRKHA